MGVCALPEIATEASVELNGARVGRKEMSTPSILKRLLTWRAAAVLLASISCILASHYAFPALVPYEAPPLMRVLLHEVGFALLVALIIWALFELFTNAEIEEQWNQRIERITRNVFFGVWRRNLPEAVIREAHLLLLEQRFIRLDLVVNYVLSDDTYDDESGIAQPYVRLEAVARYRMKNIGNTAVPMAVQIGLPNPLIEALKSKCRINKVTIKNGAGDATHLDIHSAETSFREQLADNSKYVVKFSFPPVKVQPDEEVEVVWDYVMAKEEEDTEIGQTSFSTSSLSITVLDRNPDSRIVRARSIHREPLEDNTPEASRGTYIWRLNKFVLPHQGFAIWWKKKPPQAVNPTRLEPQNDASG